MPHQNLISDLNAVRDQLRERLDANEARPEDLRASLEEMDVLWEELRSQTDALAAERKRYADFFDHAPDAYVITEPSGLIREANHAAALLLGRTQAELAGKALSSLLAEDCQPGFRAHLVAVRGAPNGTGKDWQGSVLSAAGPQLVELRVRAVKIRHKNADALCWLVRAAE